MLIFDPITRQITINDFSTVNVVPEIVVQQPKLLVSIKDQDAQNNQAAYNPISSVKVTIKDVDAQAGLTSVSPIESTATANTPKTIISEEKKSATFLDQDQNA